MRGPGGLRAAGPRGGVEALSVAPVPIAPAAATTTEGRE
jgi:hypothetical protein